MVAHPLLSRHLLEVVIPSLHEPEPGLQPEDQREVEALVQLLVTRATDGRLGVVEPSTLADDLLAAVGRDELVRLLDTTLTIETLRRVEGRVRRLLRLSELVAIKLPDSTTSGYLRQAIASYVEGTTTACVVLCRATLESALKGALDRPATSAGLDHLIRRAELERLLSAAGVVRARRVWALGNEKLHASNASSEEAFEAVLSVREVLREILGGELGAESRPL